MLRLSPNLEFLFVEVPFLERFAAAREAGFDTVEMHWVAMPGRGGAAGIGKALRDAGLTLDAFDAEVGDLAKGDRGWAADGSTGGEERFRATIDEAAENAVALGTRKVHVLAGLRNPAESRETQLSRVTDRFAWAAERLNAVGVTPVTELLNPYDNPGYVIESMADVERFVDAVGPEKLRIEFDFYHQQRVHGELLTNYRRLLPKVGHIQIADAPGRTEPGTGEIDYRNVLAAVDASDYDGHIGLEYRPKTTTTAALAWIEAFGYRRGG
jgi:hydroxypyruvate isomerase